MRYRATAQITWDFDTQLPENQAQELANKYLSEFPNPSGGNDIRVVVRLDKLKEKVEKIKLGEVKIEDVIPYLTKDDTKRIYEFDGVKYEVKMNSQRYFLFRECMDCVACGLTGSRMFLECHPADKSPHFNLYGDLDGKLILMTKDHIHAKALGGEDRHSNYQTMCLLCNNLKGHANITLDGVRELRAVYDENKTKVTKKKLHGMLEEARTRLEAEANKKPKRPKLERKVAADAVTLIHDINLYRCNSEILGKAVYDTVGLGYNHIGCIKKGTRLEPLAVSKDKVMCKLLYDEVVVLHQSLLSRKE